MICSDLLFELYLMCLVQSRKFLHLLLPIEFQLDFFVPKASADENEIIPKNREPKKERKKKKKRKENDCHGERAKDRFWLDR